MLVPEVNGLVSPLLEKENGMSGETKGVTSPLKADDARVHE